MMKTLKVRFWLTALAIMVVSCLVFLVASQVTNAQYTFVEMLSVSLIVTASFLLNCFIFTRRSWKIGIIVLVVSAFVLSLFSLIFKLISFFPPDISLFQGNLMSILYTIMRILIFVPAIQFVLKYYEKKEIQEAAKERRHKLLMDYGDCD